MFTLLILLSLLLLLLFLLLLLLVILLLLFFTATATGVILGLFGGHFGGILESLRNQFGMILRSASAGIAKHAAWPRWESRNENCHTVDKFYDRISTTYEFSKVCS